MRDEKELIRRALDLQARARDFPLTQIPAYREWSKRKLADYPTWIAHLDATSMWLLPEEVALVKEDVFEEALQELIEEFEERYGRDGSE